MSTPSRAGARGDNRLTFCPDITSYYRVTQTYCRWTTTSSTLVRGTHPNIIDHDHADRSTEAHPLIANPDIKPGSQRLWTPLPSQDLGTRGQGTDAQKWMRLDHLNRSQRPIGGRNANAPMAAGAGAGRGMGGGAYGGGRPDIKPQIPDEFKERFQNMKQNGARPRPA